VVQRQRGILRGMPTFVDRFFFLFLLCVIVMTRDLSSYKRDWWPMFFFLYIFFCIDWRRHLLNAVTHTHTSSRMRMWMETFILKSGSPRGRHPFRFIPSRASKLTWVYL
jgi:hypothetical protein